MAGRALGPLGPGYNAFHRDRAGRTPVARNSTYSGVQSKDPNGFDTRVVTASTGGEEARWRQGETHTDAAGGITIHIDDIDLLRGTAQVTIGP